MFKAVKPLLRIIKLLYGVISISHSVIYILLFLFSESAEMIGQFLTLPRWIQIVLARIKGLGVLQRPGEKLRIFQ